MFEFTFIMLLAVAVSIDSLSFGIIYGMRNIKIPVFSQTVIALFSGTVFFIAMVMGSVLRSFLSESFAETLGSFIFFVIACSYLLKANLKYCHKDTIATFSIKSLGIIIKILKEPESADMNVSGEIDLKESVFLGMALAIDAVAAGLGAAASGFSIILTSFLIAVFEFLFLYFGHLLGKKSNKKLDEKKADFFAGMIFMLISIIKMVRMC
ncbi:MAG: sporulation membrane protein YtaF [Thermovenabulum sp.]|uniref:sporulation membrane protein YtaF n=1 Tax=Thermovenabulum sp. TaxID=3100335 RepID=UPI003C7D6837